MNIFLDFNILNKILGKYYKDTKTRGEKLYNSAKNPHNTNVNTWHILLIQAIPHSRHETSVGTFDKST